MVRPRPAGWLARPSLTLPIGTNSTSGTNVQQIIYPPPVNTVYNSAMGQQRYYNKAPCGASLINNNHLLPPFSRAPPTMRLSGHFHRLP